MASRNPHLVGKPRQAWIGSRLTQDRERRVLEIHGRILRPKQQSQAQPGNADVESRTSLIFRKSLGIGGSAAARPGPG